MVAPLAQEVVASEDRSVQLQAVLDELPIREKQAIDAWEALRLEIATQARQRSYRIDDARRALQVTSTRLDYLSNLRAVRDGRLLDLQVVPGQTVKPGQRLGTLGGPHTLGLQAVTYFAPADARRLPRGLAMEVVPDWKERGRFGGIRGRVMSVNLLPATREDVATTTGNPQLAEALTRSGPVMRSLISLEPASPGVAPSHPSSKASAALPGLSRAEREVSGRYRWTLSRGSSVFPIREGLTVQAHGYVEWRAPITYLLPALRELTGTYRTLRQERQLDAPSLRQQGGPP
ncbi:MAG: HlyD family efflux transporter periplasmic adaptor subunit [Synechococcaceae cyanobacterium]